MKTNKNVHLIFLRNSEQSNIYCYPETYADQRKKKGVHNERVKSEQTHIMSDVFTTRLILTKHVGNIFSVFYYLYEPHIRVSAYNIIPYFKEVFSNSSDVGMGFIMQIN